MAQLQQNREPTLQDVKHPLVAVYGIDFGIHSPRFISRFTDMTRQAAAYRDRRMDERTRVLGEIVSGIFDMDEPRRWLGGMMSGLDVRYDLGEGQVRVFPLLHRAPSLLLNFGKASGVDITPWADCVRVVDAGNARSWELPVIGVVPAPRAVFVRPDGYVAWVGEQSQAGLKRSLKAWFPLPGAADFVSTFRKIGFPRNLY